MLILVRHGESVANAQGLLLGRTDAELTETGRAQALAARALLDGPVAEVRSSPLRRARDTAELLRWARPSSSRSNGSRSTTASSRASPWAASRPRCGGAGSATAISVPRAARPWPKWTAAIGAACEELFSSTAPVPGGPTVDVVVVSHVSPIKAAVAWALGTVDLYWRLHLRTASVTRIGWNRDAPILHGFNEVALAPRQPGAPQSPVPDASPPPTLATLRPPPGSAEEPVHRRTITMEVFDVATTSPWWGPCTTSVPGPAATTVRATSTSWTWAGGPAVRHEDRRRRGRHADVPPRRVHGHRAELPRPDRALGGAGLFRAVQERFGRERGCSHLEFLARAIGPVVIQGFTSSAA